MVHIRSKDLIVNENLGILDAAQSQYEASEKAKLNNQPDWMSLDKGIPFGNSGLGSGSGSDIGQNIADSGIKGIFDFVKNFLAKGLSANNATKKGSENQKEAAKDTADTAKDNAALAKYIAQATEQLQNLNWRQEEIDKFLAPLKAQLEEVNTQLETDGTQIKDNNEKIKTHDAKIKQDQEELAELEEEDSALFDPMGGKLILGSEGYSSKPFAMPKFDNNVTGVGSKNGKNKKTDKTNKPKKTNEPKNTKKADKTDKSDKKRKAAALKQDIQDQQTQKGDVLAQNQDLSGNVALNVGRGEELMEGGENGMNNATANRDAIASTDASITDGTQKMQSEFTGDQANATSTLTDSTGDATDAAVEVATGTAGLPPSTTLAAVPATAPVGTKGVVEATEEIGDGVPGGIMSGSATVTSGVNLAQDLAGIATNAVFDMTSKVMMAGIDAATTGSFDEASVLGEVAQVAIGTGTEILESTITGFGSDGGDNKAPEQLPAT